MLLGCHLDGSTRLVEADCNKIKKLATLYNGNFDGVAPSMKYLLLTEPMFERMLKHIDLIHPRICAYYASART